MVSKQPEIKQDGSFLPLVEEFYTIQGEGFHTGTPAYFLRVGGCDVGCSWCDTRFSWNPALHPKVPVREIVDNILVSGASTVVVTGGEPLMYSLDHLCSLLQQKRILTFLETSGAYSLSGRWNWICLSPKKNMPPLEGIFSLAHELKVIIQTENDFAWAEDNAGKVHKDCRLYLQPEWSVYEKIIPVIVDYVKHSPRWSISLQAHKFMHIP